MKVFLLDLWQDLREKRLWPVAVVLLLGLLAVPVLLAKPAEDPAPPAVAGVSVQKEEDEDEELAAIASVKLGDSQDAGSGSTLGVFDPSDPFRPPSKVVKKAKGDDGTGASVSGGNGTSPTTPGGSAGGGSTGGGTGGDEVVVVDDEDTGGDGDGDSTPKATYEYVVDVTFSANERTRRIKGLRKLDILPNAASPLLIFMGVSPKGGNAVFLVDSTLEAAGEGRCKPSGSDCAFAYIGAGSEHVFSEEDGDSYTVRVDEIRKVKVSPKSRAARGARRAKRARARGARRAKAAMRRRGLVLRPLVADLDAASDHLDDSNPDTDRR